MKKQIKLITAFAAATAAFALSANAASISVNSGPVGQEVDGQSAGAEVTSTSWNDKMAGNFGATDVKDDSGATLVGTTVSVQTSWTNTSGSGTSDGHHTLMNGGLDNGGGPQGWTIENVPYASYDVYIYYDGGSNGSRGGSMQIWDSDNSDAVLAAQSGYDTATFSGSYLQATGDGTDGAGQGLDTNYVKLTGLTASNIKIRSIADQLGGGDGTKRAPMNGFQIVESVPEPSTTALLGLGGLALVFRRRK